VVHRGVEHEDARAKVNEKLISGDLMAWGYRQLMAWGYRQILCPMPNQFEPYLRPVPKEYWDSYQLDFLSCLYYTDRRPQTAKLPGKPDVLYWTGVKLAQQQVRKFRPRQSYGRRLLKLIKRKPIIKATPDLTSTV
jgi:hypothetical protein